MNFITKIFQIYFQKILVRKLLGWILVKITKNYKILVLLGLNTVYFFCEGPSPGFRRGEWRRHNLANIAKNCLKIAKSAQHFWVKTVEWGHRGGDKPIFPVVGRSPQLGRFHHLTSSSPWSNGSPPFVPFK